MTRDGVDAERLRFLQEVTRLEVRYLAQTDARLFPALMTEAQAINLPNEPDLAERVDAFVARFGRLQDNLGDKMLPAVLRWLGEPVGPAIDNLARAERWGWLGSADDWMRVRQLRNQMIHEYVKDPAVLVDALNTAHQHVPLLVGVADALCAEIDRRLT